MKSTGATGGNLAKSQTIKVAVRIRPILPDERSHAANREKLQVHDNTTIR